MSITNIQRVVKSGRGEGKKAVIVGTTVQPKFEIGKGESAEAVLGEAIEHFGGGDKGREAILDLVNTQYGTNLINKVRAEVNTKPTKVRLQELAMDDLAKAPDFMEIFQDAARREKWLADRMATIEAGWETERRDRLAKLAEQFKDLEADEDGDDANGASAAA